MKLPQSKFISLMRRKAGEPPGVLISSPDTKTEKTKIQLISFNESECMERAVESIEEIPGLIKTDSTSWIHISGFAHIETFRSAGELFGIESLALEDILNHEHLPKAEDSSGHLFVTLKHIQNPDENGEFIMNPISMILFENLIITFARYETQIFNQFINRIRQSIGKIRYRKADYILYRLIDIITDHYFPVFDDLETELFKLEDIIENDLDNDIAKSITLIKKDIYHLKKIVLPTFEAIQNLLKAETPFIRKNNLKFFNDVSDHLKHQLQSLDNYRETAFMLMELHHSNNANKMNEVMKTLTIIATIFIPLTFIAGIYGMNFQYMPELAIKWAYPSVMIFMLLCASAMIFYMKRKKWF
jgi:magnesium transporter